MLVDLFEAFEEMGRKKRKATEGAEEAAEEVTSQPLVTGASSDPRVKLATMPPATPTTPMEVVPIKQEAKASDTTNTTTETSDADNSKTLKSGYAMTTHSAEILDEDIYVSDGSEDDDDDEKIALRDVEMVLAGSRMGIMRRGVHHPMLVQPNRQWVKEKNVVRDEGNEEEDDEAEQKRKQQEEEELAKLDPAQRAARLLAEKQRKLEEAKVTARRVESEENAGRDPCLFSKRTAFDIRFDQIDDKPWLRGDPTDFFNYSLTEDDWLEYAQQQLMIRQELTDATRQRRAPDPAIVPVTPRAPTRQAPKVAVAEKTENDDGDNNESSGGTTATFSAPVGPMPVKTEGNGTIQRKEEEDAVKKAKDIPVGLGGAWGAGAAPGSMLAKLIEEHEAQERATPKDSIYGPGGGVDNVDDGRPHVGNDYYGNSGGDGSQDWNKPYGGGGGNSYNRGHQQWDQYGGNRGGRGGRGHYGGGGRGRGGYRSNQGRGDRDDFNRKRQRDDYPDNRGGWRR